MQFYDIRVHAHLSLDMEFIKKVLMKRLSCKDYTEMWLGLRTRDSGHQRLAMASNGRKL